MSNVNFAARHRWFILALLFLGLNGYGIYLGRDALQGRRGVRAELAAPGDGRVAGRDTLRWRFSADMVAPAATGAWFAAGPVKFAPDAKGAFCWLTPRELAFRPDAEWTPCTDFKAMFGDDLCAADLRPLAQRNVFSFHTDALVWSGVSQVDYSETHGLRLQLEFSAAVDPKQVGSALSITDSVGQAVSFCVDQQCSGKTMTVSLPRPPQGDITLRLPAGLQGATGPRGLERDFASHFKPEYDLQVIGIHPAISPFGPNSILLRFNRPVRAEAAADFIAVDDLAQGFTVEAGSRYYWETPKGLRLIGAFQPSRTYAVTLKKGLPCEEGASLPADVTRNAYMPDAEPGLDVTGGGYYFSPQGGMLLPFRTVGMTRCRITLRRIYPNNLVHLATRRANPYAWYDRDPADGLAHDIMTKEFAIGGRPNEIVEHRLALRELIGDRRGAFEVIILAANGRDSREDRRHAIVSDTGLSIRQSGAELLVWANSIRTLQAVTGALVQVYSAENQELASALTDADGLARLEPDANGVQGVPFLVTARQGDDLTYLALAGSEVEVKGGVGARPFLREGYEAFLFTDRGIYRPGETAHLKAVVRGRDAACPPAFPVRLNIYRPDNRLEKTLNAMLTACGTAEFEIPWPDFTPTGNYRLELALPSDRKALGSARVAVEDFVPPQIRVDIKPLGERGRAGEEMHVDLRADYLFGRPAAGLMAGARIEFVPDPVAFPHLPGFAFGDDRKPFKDAQSLAGKVALDSTGRARFTFKASPEWCPPAALKAVIVGTVTEIGGRGVSAYSSRPVDVYPYYIGVKPGAGEIGVGREHPFEVVTVGPAGAVTDAVGQLKLTVEKLTWTSVLKRGAGDAYCYASERRADRVLARPVALAAGKASIRFAPASGGDYRLALADPDSGASSAIEFHAADPGQQWTSRSMEAPDTVELKFDKERYAAGETATLLIKAPFTGKALVTLESTNVLSRQVLVLDKNTAELKFPVKAEYAPNIYCAVTLIRPAVSEKLWGRHRAAGLVSLAVDAPAKKARLTLDAPERIRPRQRLEVGVAVADGDGRGLQTEVVVAAVDEGICMLTDFKTPDPYGFFFEPRLPAGKLCDLYSLLAPELEPSVGGAASSPGGDAFAGLGKRLNPVKARRFKPVALWASGVMTDAAGRATVSFEVPEFTGQLRLMAVAVDRERFAAADRQVAVVRPLVVQSSLPRFLAPNDRCSVPVQIMNETGQGGEAAVRLSCAGPLSLDDGGISALRRIVLEKGAVTNIAFVLAARPAPGKATCRIEVTMAGERFEEETELAVRPPAGRGILAGTGRAAPGETVAIDVPVRWLEPTGETDIWLASLPAVQLGGSLDYLLDYPYGCLEQTVSQSFPLLYLAELSGQTHPGWVGRGEVECFVQSGIQRILSMQRGDGGFSLWPGGEAYDWGAIYAAHFLIEAVKAGYKVPEERIQAACNYLEGWMARRVSSAEAAQDADDFHNRAYACYVLARAGRPQSGWMIRLREQEAKLDRDTRAYLAAALIAAGKRREGAAVLGSVATDAAVRTARQAGGSLRSGVKEDAVLLTAWLEADPENAAIPGLVRRLELGREDGRWTTTQENAAALMALGKYCRLLAGDRKTIAGRVAWQGLKPRAFSGCNEHHASFWSLSGGRLELTNSGAGPIYYYWKSEGVPADGKLPEEDRGLRVRRAFLDLAGKPLDPEKLSQGELVVVGVTLDAGAEQLANIVVEDLLPAGLEIENVNLKTSEAVGWCKTNETLRLLHADIRDDRMVAFPAPFSGRQSYFYAARAVTPGEFSLPAVLASGMYDPSVRSAHGGGKITVANYR